MMKKDTVLSVTKCFDIRFSEVDSMGVVWHGNYAKYFEDAREEFGRKYDLEYLMMYDKGFFEPIVELSFKYKRRICNWSFGASLHGQGHTRVGIIQS